MQNSAPARSSSLERSIILRTRGNGHGAITRLMSPSDHGQLLKPFVFLDLFEAEAAFMGSMPIHPHSGIATITVITEGDVRFDDPREGTGRIAYGGVEWMRASGGVWHGQEMSRGNSERVRGFQLWVALPPELENGPSDNQYIEAPGIPQVGPARVIVGAYDGARSPVRAPDGLLYLLVTLKPGEMWTFVPPSGQEIAWLAVSRGVLRAPEPVREGELVAFEPSLAWLNLEADDETGAVFVLGAAIPHEHNLELGYYSVHTSQAALQQGEARIAALGEQLRAAGSRQTASGSTPVFR